MHDSKENLEKNMLNYLNLNILKKHTVKITNKNFLNEKIFIKDIDYYYSNAIARASKTMSDCRNLKINSESTGIEG